MTLSFSVFLQPVCGSGQQGCEPGRKNQTGPRTTQILHEGACKDNLGPKMQIEAEVWLIKANVAILKDKK